MLRAGNFSGRIGNVISPIPGLSGAQLRGAAVQIALGRGFGSVASTLCAGGAIAGGAATAYSSGTKVDPMIGLGITAFNTLVGGACPSPAAPSPAQQTASADSAQLAAVQAQMAQMQQVQMQQQAQQAQLQSMAARAPATQSKGMIAGMSKDTLMYVGGAAALAVVGYFLLRK